jgi:hypothetical protein
VGRDDLQSATVGYATQEDRVLVSGMLKNPPTRQFGPVGLVCGPLDEWQRTWHNGVQRWLQTPLPQAKAFEAWAAEKFGAKKPDKAKPVVPEVKHPEASIEEVEDMIGEIPDVFASKRRQKMSSWYRNASDGENRNSLIKSAQGGPSINPEFFDREHLQKMKLDEKDVMMLINDMMRIAPDTAAAAIGLTWGEILNSSKKAIDAGPVFPPDLWAALVGDRLKSEDDAKLLVSKLVGLYLNLTLASRNPGAPDWMRSEGMDAKARKMLHAALGIREGELKKRFDEFAPMLAEQVPTEVPGAEEAMTPQQKSDAKDFLLDQYNTGKMTVEQLRERMKEFAAFLAGMTKHAQAMRYPYYIAEVREGRLKGMAPHDMSMIPSLRRQWDRGGFGTGTKLREFRSADFGDLAAQVRRAGFDTRDAEFFAIRGPNSPKQKVFGDELFALLRQAAAAKPLAKTAQVPVQQHQDKICWWCENGFDDSPLEGQDLVVVKGEPMHAVCAREAARFARLDEESGRDLE